MSYLPPYLDENGLHMPTYEERLADLIEKYKAIFGDDVYIDPDSMDYQMLSIFAKHLSDMSAVLVDTYNARNPDYASGVSLDTLLPLNGLSRKAATQSTCELFFRGTPGATVGADESERLEAIDVNGNVWRADESVTFDANGDGTAMSHCMTYGAITAGIGTINQLNIIFQDVDSVTNIVEATPGIDVETDAEVRLRRSQSMAIPALASESAIRSGLVNLPGVLSVNLVSNNTGSTVDGIPAHSFCAVVEGGDDNAIAEMIWKKKAPGVGTYGDESVSYTDVFNHQNIINFSRPSFKGVSVTVEFTVFALIDESLLKVTIPNAIAEYINSLSIGEDLLVTKLYGVIYNANPTSSVPFSVKTIKVSGNSQTNVTSILDVGYDEKLTLNEPVVTMTPSTYDPSVTEYKIEVVDGDL